MGFILYNKNINIATEIIKNQLQLLKPKGSFYVSKIIDTDTNSSTLDAVKIQFQNEYDINYKLYPNFNVKGILMTKKPDKLLLSSLSD